MNRNMEEIQVKKSIHKYAGQSRCYYLGERDKNRFIYKYMDLEAAIVSLSTDTIRFVEPLQWEDRYEARFYNASYANVCNAAGNTPPLLANCFSHEPMNEAAWKIYSHAKAGLGARCVKLKINKKAFRDMIVRMNADYRLYEGVVNYVEGYHIDNLHRRQYPNGRPNDLYDKVFSNFDLSSYLSLLLIKRPAFRHEQELRYFMIPKAPMLRGDIGSVNLQINWKELLTGISVDENCTDTELEILNRILCSKGISISPKREFIYSMRDEFITIE